MNVHRRNGILDCLIDMAIESALSAQTTSSSSANTLGGDFEPDGATSIAHANDLSPIPPNIANGDGEAIASVPDIQTIDLMLANMLEGDEKPDIAASSTHAVDLLLENTADGNKT